MPVAEEVDTRGHRSDNEQGQQRDGDVQTGDAWAWRRQLTAVRLALGFLLIRLGRDGDVCCNFAIPGFLSIFFTIFGLRLAFAVPLVQLRAVRVNGAELPNQQPANRQALVPFPALDRPDLAPQVRGNLSPRFEPGLVGRRIRNLTFAEGRIRHLKLKDCQSGWR